MLRISGQSTPTTQRKIVFKGFKVPPSLPTDFQEKNTELLVGAIRAIHEHTTVTGSLEDLYKAVEDLCRNKCAPALYDRVSEMCSSRMKTLLPPLLKQMQLHQQQQPDMALRHLDTMWHEHCNQMTLIRNIFMYLDRSYVLHLTGIHSLWNLALQQFRDIIMSNDAALPIFMDCILKLISNEREGEIVDRMLLNSALHMANDLGLYKTIFEPQFLQKTIAHYGEVSKKHTQSMDVPEYLRYCEARIKEEGERVLHYLFPGTKSLLLSAVQEQLLKAHTSFLLEKGFDSLVQNERHTDLERMYDLFSQVEETGSIKQFFVNYIKNTGKQLVMDPSRDSSMVQDLLAFKSKLLQVLEKSFHNESVFAQSFKDSFESFINERPSKPAEMIAKYVDQYLRSGNKGISDSDLEAILDNAMSLFRYISGKDVFEAFYKVFLSRRLLLGKSASLDMEKAMVTRLKAECGSGFTSKLEGMFKDIDLSKDLLSLFKSTAATQMPQNLQDIDLNVFILTQSCWPSTPTIQVKLPTELNLLQQHFTDFYLKKYGGRKLQFNTAMGSCLLKAYFPTMRKEFHMSHFQASVLLMFNQSPSLTFAEIREAIGLGESELKNVLLSLTGNKVPILSKSPVGGSIEESDAFNWNHKFSSKQHRIKINSLQIQETPEENAKTKESVFQDRMYAVDATIVRIMKTRKQLHHNQLVAELYKQLKFPATPADLKKRIDSLIEREYMEKNEETQVYEYMA
ncbi:cullin 4 [Pelomyxa schiedti]|nr:cullin 4 [Pelomyxa schiedti]